MANCYWCGKNVLNGHGAREHIIPKTILQDVVGYRGNLIISKKNAHKSCNQMLGNAYEHDFCQIIFHHAYGDERAKKHGDSKIRNLKTKKTYTANQFDKMKVDRNRTVIQLSNDEKYAFEMIVKKILKGLFFKQNRLYLDLETDYLVKIDWKTINLEYDPNERKKVAKYLLLINDIDLVGNSVFKYRYKQVEGGLSSIWEFLFYERFPIHIYLIHDSEKYAFNVLN